MWFIPKKLLEVTCITWIWKTWMYKRLVKELVSSKRRVIVRSRRKVIGDIEG